MGDGQMASVGPTELPGPTGCPHPMAMLHQDGFISLLLTTLVIIRLFHLAVRDPSTAAAPTATAAARRVVHGETAETAETAEIGTDPGGIEASAAPSVAAMTGIAHVGCLVVGEIPTWRPSA